MTAIDPRSARLSELSQCAYRLGLAFGREAEAAEEFERKLEYFRLFDRCFFSVRVSIALELRLGRASGAPGEVVGEAGSERDDFGDRADPPENERPDSDPDLERERLGDAEDRDRDRDREVEPASLPVLLRTLDEIVIAAEALPGPEPAALPTLRELLAHMTPVRPQSASAPASAARAGLRTRLAAGAAIAVTFPKAPRLATLAGGLAVRRATGPPRR